VTDNNRRPSILPSVSLRRDGERRLSVVIEKQSHSLRTRYEVTAEPFFLRCLVFVILVGSVSSYSLTAFGSHSRTRSTSMNAATLDLLPTLMFERAQAAMQNAAACVTEECFVGALLEDNAPAWGAQVGRLVQSDVTRLGSSLQAMHRELCVDAADCTVLDVLGAAALHLDEWGRARAPIIHWASVRCLRSLGLADIGPIGQPPTLGECLAPLTREMTPLLAKCLVASPWRACRLAFRYTAFRAVTMLSGVFGAREQWIRQRDVLLPKLLEEINLALDDGWARHEAAIGGGGAHGTTRAGECVRLASAALRGEAGPASLGDRLAMCCNGDAMEGGPAGVGGAVC